MLPRVNAVRHVKDYELELSFTDGIVATIDFRPRIAGRGAMFIPLQSLDYFKQLAVDQEAGTIVWPNGIDFCPNVLYAEATGE
jgi:hypothetical protein